MMTSVFSRSLWPLGLLILVSFAKPAWAQDSPTKPDKVKQKIEFPMPEKEFQQTVSGDPFWLVHAVLHASWERRLNGPHSVSGMAAWGGYGGAPYLMLGAQYRQYFKGDFDVGVHWGADVRLMSMSRLTLGGGAQLAPVIGAKYTAPKGFMTEIQLGPGVQFTSSGTAASIVQNVRIGYSF